MKTIYVKKSKDGIRVKNIPPGQVFLGKIGSYKDFLFKKIAPNGKPIIISLTSIVDNDEWWDSGDLIVEDYEPVCFKLK